MIATNDEILDKLSKQFEELQSNLECYLIPPEELSNELVSSTKSLYDLMKNHAELEVTKKKSAPQQLLTKNFDNEQIWQQIHLQNVHQLRQTKKLFSNMDKDLITLKADYLDKEIDLEEASESELEHDENVNAEGEDSEDEEEIEDELDSEDDIEDGEDDMGNNFVEKNYKPSIVDDKFFKLRQLEEFLDQQDKLEELRRDETNQTNTVDSDDDDDIAGDENDDIDLFAEGMDEEG